MISSEIKYINFSIIIPVYVKENPVYLKECLASVQKQTLKPQEVIICIDRSITSEIRKALDSFKDALNIVEYVYSGKNQLGGSLNLGVLKSNNDMIIRMDADDICFEGRFEKLINFFVKEDLDLLGSWTEEFYTIPGDLKYLRKTPQEIKKGSGWWRCPFNHPSVIFKRHKVLEAGNYQRCLGFEDWYLWLRMKSKGMNMSNIPEPLVFQRIGNGFEFRRSGKDYLRKKIQALRLWSSLNLIPKWVFLLTIIIEVIFRNLPKKIVKLIYLKLLRKKTI